MFPCVRHLVDRAVAPSYPLVRIGIVRIGGRVIVPGGNLDHRAFRQHRRGVVGIDVVVIQLKLK